MSVGLRGCRAECYALCAQGKAGPGPGPERPRENAFYNDGGDLRLTTSAMQGFLLRPVLAQFLGQHLKDIRQGLTLPDFSAERLDPPTRRAPFSLGHL